MTSCRRRLASWQSTVVFDRSSRVIPLNDRRTQTQTDRETDRQTDDEAYGAMANPDKQQIRVNRRTIYHQYEPQICTLQI